MPIRQFLTTGVAFATVGMVAAIPAIAPPLQPQDVQVVNATEAQVRLAAAVTPSADGPHQRLLRRESRHKPSTIRLSSWATGMGPSGCYPRRHLRPHGRDLPAALAAADDDTDAATAVDGLFTLGMAKVIGDYLYYNTDDPALQRAIFAWFGGGINGEGGLSNLVRQLLIDRSALRFGRFRRRLLVNQYFAGGATRLAFLGLRH